MQFPHMPVFLPEEAEVWESRGVFRPTRRLYDRSGPLAAVVGVGDSFPCL